MIKILTHSVIAACGLQKQLAKVVLQFLGIIGIQGFLNTNGNTLWDDMV